MVHGKSIIRTVFDVTDASRKSASIAGLRVMVQMVTSKRNLNLEGCRTVGLCRVSTEYCTWGELSPTNTLRRLKEDVGSSRRGDDCGLGLTGFNDLEEGGVVE